MAETEKQKKARLLNAAKRKQRQDQYAKTQAATKGVQSKGGALTEMKRTTPADVSATGRTGPKKAPHSGRVQPIADPNPPKTMKATRTPSSKKRITTGDSRNIVMGNPKRAWI